MSGEHLYLLVGPKLYGCKIQATISLRSPCYRDLRQALAWRVGLLPCLQPPLAARFRLEKSETSVGGFSAVEHELKIQTHPFDNPLRERTLSTRMAQPIVNAYVPESALRGTVCSKLF